MSSVSISDALFSKTRQRVLTILYGMPDRSFYTNEIMRRVDMGRGTVTRELERLVSAGLLVMRREGNQHHYQANPDSPVYEELRNLMGKLAGENGGIDITDDQHTRAIAPSLSISRKALEDIAKRHHVTRLILFGSAVRGELKPESDIDLLVEFERGRSPSLGGMVELQNELSILFGGHKVDVATWEILNNPYRKRAIEKEMKEVYAA